MPIANPFDFSGQVVLLTGPTGTLGRPMARAFADAGATLAPADVDAIAPGHTDSPMVDKMMPDRAQVDAAIARMPVHQLLPPDAQVAPTMFLASDAARWITGVTLRVDGGWHTT